MSCEILSLLYSFGHRSESWLYWQISELKRYRVYVLTYEYKNPQEYPYPFIKILPISSKITRYMLKMPLLILERRRPRLDLRELFIISRIIKQEKIKIIQAHFGWTGYRFLELTSKFNLPYIVWFYGSDAFRSQYQAMVQELINSPVIFCCTSNALKRRLEELGCSGERVYVFHPGIRLPTQLPNKMFKHKEPLRIISIGRLTDVKDPCALVKIAKILQEKGIDFTWQHFGDGDLRPMVEAEIAKHNLTNRFFLLGERPNEQVLEALKFADVMVHNAVIAPDGGREAFGFVLVEASAFGVPVVSVRVGGIPEIVQDQKTGFLLDEGDIEGMAEKVILLAKNPELREQFGREAYRFASQKFDLNSQIKKLEEFYDQLIKKQNQI